MALRELATFTVTIKGTKFLMRRRTTKLMLEVGDPRQVFGLLSASQDEKMPEAQREKMAQRYVEAALKMEQNIVAVALIEVDGESAITIPTEELEPVAGVLLKAFISSGLQADPMPSS